MRLRCTGIPVLVLSPVQRCCAHGGEPTTIYRRSDLVHRILYTLYRAWLGGAALADDANHALLALIPKQTEAEDSTLGLFRHLKNLRPLSMSNTDVKIFAMALNAVVAPALPSWARPEQNGFIMERIILQNVVDVESSALEAALRACMQSGPDLLLNPAAIFFDFGAAFPSLAQLFLWLLLGFIGFPEFVVSALKELYRENKHFWRFRGQLRYLYTVYSGVKQGCPFSTSLFVLAMDPFIAALAAAIGPRGCVRVYADDVAVVLWHLVAQAPCVDAVFHIWARIAALRIRHDKCVIVPLWTLDLRRLRIVVQECVPFWSTFTVSLAAKYLGFFLGPDSHRREWAAASAKYLSRMAQLQRVTDGLQTTMLLHNVQALPVLYYLAQLRDVPDEVCRQQDAQLELLTKGPRRWFFLEAAYNLDRLIDVPLSFTRLRDMDPAIKVRAGAAPGLKWREQAQSLFSYRWHRDQRLLPACHDWLERSAVMTLHRAAEAYAARVPDHRKADSAQSMHVALYESLRQAHGATDFERLLRRRWTARWADCFRAGLPLGPAVRRAVRCMHEYGSALPPFLKLAVLTTWLNGWCTAHRFQSRAPCLFCAGPSDALEHLAPCARVRAHFQHHLGTSHSAFHEFLGLYSDPARFTAQARGLHAAKTAVESGRLSHGLAARASVSARFRAALQESVRKWRRAARLVFAWTLCPPAAAPEAARGAVGAAAQHLRTLELPANASPDDVRRAYRRLALRHHPDKNPGEAQAEATRRFREISEAYEALRG